jgi:hypothetical protein
MTSSFLPPYGSERVGCFGRRLSFAAAADRFWVGSIGRDEPASLAGFCGNHLQRSAIGPGIVSREDEALLSLMDFPIRVL